MEIIAAEPARDVHRLPHHEEAGNCLRLHAAGGERGGVDAATAQIKAWRLLPAGTEGYAKAEVTLGGVDTAALASRDCQARAVPGLFVVGEAVDVTGWLGGYNFQWAWSSGWVAGQAV